MGFIEALSWNCIERWCLGVLSLPSLSRETRSSLSREEVLESWDDRGAPWLLSPSWFFHFLVALFGGRCWLGPREDFFDVGLLLLWAAS